MHSLQNKCNTYCSTQCMSKVGNIKVSGVYVLGGMCPGGKCRREVIIMSLGYVFWGYMPGGFCPVTIMVLYYSAGLRSVLLN